MNVKEVDRVPYDKDVVVIRLRRSCSHARACVGGTACFTCDGSSLVRVEARVDRGRRFC